MTLNVVRSVSPLTSQDHAPVLKRMAAAPKISKLVPSRKKKKEFFQTDKEGHYVFQQNDVFLQ